LLILLELEFGLVRGGRRRGGGIGALLAMEDGLYLTSKEISDGGRIPRNSTLDSQGIVEDGLYLTSKEISHGGRIPRKFTQDSQGAVKDISPPLEWYGVPEDTQSLVVFMEDPDVPEPENPSGVPWVHW
jgi:phosphatidylethanolamine-binding protein (PEBP) family uncharacterized protein